MIAISYRREDSTSIAGRLHDRLRAEFGKENVFMDFDSIPYGVDFRDHIAQTLERADILVAVIGPGWLGHRPGESTRRVDDATDFVRLEIAGALQRGIPVIPILVDKTCMPIEDTLPDDLKPLVFRNALMLDSGIDFHHHADRLITGIRSLLKNIRSSSHRGSRERSRNSPEFARDLDDTQAARGRFKWFGVLDRLRSPTPTEQQEHERGVKPTALTSAVEPVTTAPKEISAQSDDTEAGAGGTALPETSKLSETDLDFERYGGGAIERLEVPSPKTRRAARAAKQFNKESVSLIIAGALLIVAAVIAVWYFGFFQNFGKTRNVVTTQPTATESKPEPKTSPPIETPAPPTAAPMPESSVTANAVYEGTIHVKNDSSTNVPLGITIGSDLKSGTMTESGRRGDVVVKFTGIWDGNTLHAVTDQVVSAPKEMKWEPESFTLRFAEDGKSASYECFAEGKTYIAELSAQSAPAIKAAPVYEGTIHSQGESGSGTPLTINLAADRKSGTMTQKSKSGDSVVKFNGIWDGDILRAVTNEVISKPKNVQWKPESFTLHFADDGKTATYECLADGKMYVADLSSDIKALAPLSEGPQQRTSRDAGVLYAPQPTYPSKARKRRITGSGRFGISFDERGLAKSVKTLESTGNQILDSDAIKTLKQWRAEPGTPEIVVPVTYKNP